MTLRVLEEQQGMFMRSDRVGSKEAAATEQKQQKATEGEGGGEEEEGRSVRISSTPAA